MDDSLRQGTSVVFMGLGLLSAVCHVLRSAGAQLPFERFHKAPSLQRAWGERADLAMRVVGSVITRRVVGFSMWCSTW